MAAFTNESIPSKLTKSGAAKPRKQDVTLFIPQHLSSVSQKDLNMTQDT